MSRRSLYDAQKKCFRDGFNPSTEAKLFVEKFLSRKKIKVCLFLFFSFLETYPS
jgi:hypothetical protein